MRYFLAIICYLVLLFSGSAQVKYRLPAGISRDQVSEEWVIVKLKGSSASLGDSRNEVVALHETRPGQESILDGMCKIKVRKGEDPVELINRLLKSENVLYAEPILDYQPLYLPSDPSNVTNQSYLSQISATAAWDITRGDDDITIAIIDSGLDLDHEDLASSIWTNDDDPIDGLDNDENGYVDDFYGYDFADGDNDPNADGSTHGTRVGGVAAADTDNSVGISGVGFNSKIAALKGFRTVGTTSNNLFEAIIYAVDNGMQILNLSWGSLRSGLQSEQDIIDYAVLEKNAVIVAAAGNTNVDGKFHPASYNNVLSVGAVNSSDSKWSSSTFNYSVDLMAPGVAIYSAHKDDEYGVDNGTSYAAPMVAGAAALVLSEFPELNALQVMERLRVSVDDINDIGSNASLEGKLGLGRLNVFNAVSKTDLKSLRVKDFNTETSISGSLFYGDTVKVTADFTNYLDVLTNPLISISSPDNNFTPIQNSIYPGRLTTLQEKSLSFDIILDSALEPDTPLAVRLDFSDGTYADFQFLETSTAPDHFDIGSNLKMTVAGNGNLGFADAAFEEGVGAEFNGETLLKHAGIMLATSETTVSDNMVSGYSFDGREQDFSNQTNFKLLHHPAADQFGYSTFADNTNGLLIEQSSYSYQSEDFILLRYRIVNTSNFDLTDLSVGFFTDFDLNNSLTNKSAYEETKDYQFTVDLDEALYAGTKILANGTARYSAIDIESENGNTADIEDVFSDAEKYDFLRNQQIDSAGTLGDGNDVAMMNGITFDLIPSFGNEFFTVIIATSNTQSGLESAFSSAESQLENIKQNPPVLETIYGCAGSTITLDPTAGESFRFYQDADGTTLLFEGASLETGIINSDTVFYVQNVDSAYSSDLFQYSVKLVDNVADFTMSTDTLYLDNTTNVVLFTDKSFQATSWLWDFGEGTTTALQNPSLAFSKTGTYEISLSVENPTGCADIATQTLIVAERPNPPSLEPFTVCPGESITISDVTADYLKIFDTEDAAVPSQQGSDLSVGPIVSSTIIYVSGVYSQYESLRTPVTISIENFEAGFSFEIDTLSADHNVIARAITEQSAFEWFINDSSVGSNETITIASDQDNFMARLDVSNGEGCTISTTKSFEFSSSPVPSQSDLTVCANEVATIKPGNGHIFGFYHDESLTDLIKKGTEMTLSGETKLFVVGLDDGLPSRPVEVNLTYETFDLEILTTTEVIAAKNKVSFSSNPPEGIRSFEWYVDGSLVETSASPILLFENTSYEVVLAAINVNGCAQSDTLQLDFTIIPPLGIADEQHFSVYPNPSNGMMKISSDAKPTSLSVWDITGKNQLQLVASRKTIDLTHLPTGIFILRAEINGETYQIRIIIQRSE